MKLHFYGTSGGGAQPELYCSCRICNYAREHRGPDMRSRSQALVNDALLIEFPVDTMMHCFYGGLDVRKYHHVLITHDHYDHFLQQELIDRPIGATPHHYYTTWGSGSKIREKEEAGKKLDQTNHPRPRMFPVWHEVKYFEPTEIVGHTVIPLRARHVGPELQAAIYIIGDGEKNLLWGTDTGYLPDDTWDYIENEWEGVLDGVVLDCTLHAEQAFTPSHMNLPQCVEVIRRLEAAGKLKQDAVKYVTHISHLTDMTHDELSAEAAKYGIKVAYDGLDAQI